MLFSKQDNAFSRYFGAGGVPGCVVNYNLYHKKLEGLPWEDVVSPSSQKRVTRKSCWMTRAPCRCAYKYGHKVWKSSPIPPWLETLIGLVCSGLGVPEYDFNSCNANAYLEEDHGLAWHSDNEPLFRATEFDRDVFIISISFGASRYFGIRKKYSMDAKYFPLHDGDISTMEGRMQCHYDHMINGGVSVPGSNDADKIRYNLTVRGIKRHDKSCACRSGTS